MLGSQPVGVPLGVKSIIPRQSRDEMAMFGCSHSRDAQYAREASGFKQKGGLRNPGMVRAATLSVSAESMRISESRWRTWMHQPAGTARIDLSHKCCRDSFRCSNRKHEWLRDGNGEWKSTPPRLERRTKPYFWNKVSRTIGRLCRQTLALSLGCR